MSDGYFIYLSLSPLTAFMPRVYFVLQAGVFVRQKDHASVQLHGAGGVFLQLSGSAERRPAGGLQTLPGHLSEVNRDLHGVYVS